VLCPIEISENSGSYDRAPPPGKHFGFFGEKKFQVFSPAAADKTLHALKFFLKLDK
jgi:hypothetical protein